MLATDLIVYSVVGGGSGIFLTGFVVSVLRWKNKVYAPAKLEEQRKKLRAKAIANAAECRAQAKRYGNANDLASRTAMLLAADTYDALARQWHADLYPEATNRTLLPAPVKVVEDTPEEMR